MDTGLQLRGIYGVLWEANEQWAAQMSCIPDPYIHHMERDRAAAGTQRACADAPGTSSVGQSEV